MDSLLPGLTAAPLHPMFVHFPIALWFTALPVVGFALVRDHEGAWRMGRILFELATLAAAVTVATGFIASNDLGHDSPGHDLVHTHRNLMLAAAAMAVVAVAVGRFVAGRAGRVGVAALAAVVCIITVFGADRGAYLVYGKGVGVDAQAHGDTADGEH